MMVSAARNTTCRQPGAACARPAEQVVASSHGGNLRAAELRDVPSVWTEEFARAGCCEASPYTERAGPDTPVCKPLTAAAATRRAVRELARRPSCGRAVAPGVPSWGFRVG